MENLEMDDMKEITKEMAIKAAAAAMANYFSDLYLKEDLVGLLHNLNPEKFREDHFKGFKEFKEGKEKMDLKA